MGSGPRHQDFQSCPIPVLRQNRVRLTQDIPCALGSFSGSPAERANWVYRVQQAGRREGAAEDMADRYVERRHQMFPQLTPAQIGRIASLGERRSVRSGEVLLELGEQDTRFFVVIEGAIEIVRPVAGREERITVHGPGEFTGEIDVCSSDLNLVRGRAIGDASIVVVDREHLRALVQRDFELREILMRAVILRRVALIAQGGSGLVLIGSRHSARTLSIREFLSRNGQPSTYQEVESEPDVQALLDRFHVGVDEVPVVVCETGAVLRNPTIETLASGLGLSRELDAAATRDVVVVGAGPAGLAAAVYAASEGLDVLVLEDTAPGGQAGSSSRIENYLGFPTGISGQDLAGRALTQAEKFGTEVAIARRAVGLDCTSTPYKVRLATGEVVRTRTVVIASGAKYRKPALPELSRFEGAGVMYSATHVEAQTRPIRHLFLMTGADPNTAWLKGCVAFDGKDFVKTGADLDPGELEDAGWPLARRPDLLETSRPGVFAVGDVRSGSVKRVASAVGEGSVCVQLIHRALREL